MNIELLLTLLKELRETAVLAAQVQDRQLLKVLTEKIKDLLTHLQLVQEKRQSVSELSNKSHKDVPETGE